MSKCNHNEPIGLNHPVYWNPYNGVIQCHRCGEQFVPMIDLAAAKEVSDYHNRECGAMCSTGHDRIHWSGGDGGLGPCPMCEAKANIKSLYGDLEMSIGNYRLKMDELYKRNVELAAAKERIERLERVADAIKCYPFHDYPKDVVDALAALEDGK